MAYASLVIATLALLMLRDIRDELRWIRKWLYKYQAPPEDDGK